jgi:hypothetical protein
VNFALTSVIFRDETDLIFTGKIIPEKFKPVFFEVFFTEDGPHRSHAGTHPLLGSKQAILANCEFGLSRRVSGPD